MTKKNTRRQKNGRRRPHNRKRFPLRDSPQRPSLREQIVSFLATQETPASTAVIMKGLDLPGHARKPVKEILIALIKSGKIQQKNKTFLAMGTTGLKRATLALTSRGFGFATMEGQGPNEKDIFIHQNNLGSASHGDTILIKILGKPSRGRQEGSVVKVLERAVTTLCGIYTEDNKGGHLLPDDSKLPFTVFIHRGKSKNAANGTAVLARITDYGTEKQGPSGEILEILGDPLTVPVQLRMALEQLMLPRSFPEEVLHSARQLEPVQTCEEGQRDLRSISHVTIDGATAKDFDDAVAVEEISDGFRLYVSIADVSHYVKTGSVIDKEAYKRGTSVYFPDLVLPMLPERLSNDLCSLVPQQDRPAFSVILDFDRNGKQRRAEFCRSMINSRQRFTYGRVHRLLFLKEPEEQKKHAALLPMLTAAAKLSNLLRKRREKRGSLGFNIPEAEIQVDNNHITSMGHAQRNEAHLLIEDFMLAANEAVAKTLAQAGKKVLYRIHERPDPTKVTTFTEAAGAMGLHLKKADINPAWFAGVLDEARDKPAEYVINNLLLRTMQQARYSPDNLGHFGLAAEYYLHFTSPIRRYPDLIAHRVLHNFLVQQTGKGKQLAILSDDNLALAALHLSKRERIAIDGERDVQARLACLFLLDRIGETFAAVISGVTSFGLFIELLEFFIRGAIPLRSMTDDYYLFDSRAHRLIGERHNRVYQLGHTVTVRLEHVDMADKRITFSLFEEEA